MSGQHLSVQAVVTDLADGRWLVRWAGCLERSLALARRRSVVGNVLVTVGVAPREDDAVTSALALQRKADLSRSPVELAVTSDAALKDARLDCYASQMAVLGESRRVVLAGSERYWRIVPPVAPLQGAPSVLAEGASEPSEGRR
jgi:hypothetical protein